MNSHRTVGLDLVGCPGCGAPAEVVDRFTSSSTSGPVEHLTVHCARRHRFTLPADSTSLTHSLPIRTRPSPSPVTTAGEEPGR